MSTRTFNIALCILGLNILTCSQMTKPIKTEHGWKTKHVIATRYKNPMLGYNIGFTFPLNPDDCDRDEIVQYIDRNGGFIYEMGGYRDAPVMTRFKGVTDKESADKKLLEVLPGLERVVAKF